MKCVGREYAQSEVAGMVECCAFDKCRLERQVLTYEEVEGRKQTVKY